MQKTKFQIVKETKTPGQAIRYNAPDGTVKESLVRWNAEVLPDTQREVIWIEGEQSATDIKDVIL